MTGLWADKQNKWKEKGGKNHRGEGGGAPRAPSLPPPPPPPHHGTAPDHINIT